MKRGCYINVGVQCPYYKCQNSQIIYCTGEEEGQSFHVAFSDRGKKAVWQKKYCGYGDRRSKISGDYKKCSIFKIIDDANQDK